MPYLSNPIPNGTPIFVHDNVIYTEYLNGNIDLYEAVRASYGLSHPLTQSIKAFYEEFPPEQEKDEEEDMSPSFLDRTLKKAFSKKHKFPEVKGEVGLELECEGRHLFMSPVSFWKAIGDGSLRAVENHPPVEYVLREPVAREKVGDALSYLARRLKSAGSELVFSHRCSVHVHINALDLTIKQIANFLVLYFILEELLVEFSGEERAGNLFCLRAKDACFQIEILVTALRSFNFGDVFNQNFRYSACNITSLGQHGSLEFRSMRGTVDTETIQTWVSLLLHLKDMARSYSDPAEIGQEFMHMGPGAFVDKFLADCPVSTKTKRFFSDHKLLHQVLWDGFRTTRDVAFAVDWNNPPSLTGRVSRTTNDGDIDYDE